MPSNKETKPRLKFVHIKEPARELLNDQYENMGVLVT